MLMAKNIMRNYKFLIGLTCIIAIIFGAYGIYLNTSKKNVVLIVVDSLRPDHLGCYSYYRDTSPNIDSFSKEAIIFKNVLSQSSVTTSSVTSFLTSSYPNEHKLFKANPKIISGVYIDPSKPTLIELLKRNNYATSLIADIPSLFLIFGITRGLDSFINAGYNDPEIITKNALNWIKKNKNKKFFIYLHYFGPHYPYNPNLASRLKEELRKKDIFLPLQDYDEGFGIIPRVSMDDHILTLNHYLNNYDGKILYTDAQIGIFLQNIRKLNLEKNTIIIIMADHGEGFGEHHLYCSHGYILYNEIIKVPLIIRFPEKRFQHKLISNQVALLDLMPTVLDYLNIKGYRCKGISLMQLIKGKPNIKDRIIYSELPRTNACITNDKYKLIYNIQTDLSRQKYLPTSEFEFYDLVKDPQEQNNLFSNELKISGFFKKHLLGILQNLKFSEVDQTPTLNIKTEDIEKIKSLGYVNQ
jgi:arylsulfatase A-like enzyme